MEHTGLQKMSKKVEKKARRLVRKAENRAMVIRRVVRDYNDAERISTIGGNARQLERQRQIEQAVMKYNQANKAIGRLRKKIQLKDRDPRDFLRDL
ncbi:MAG: hypothetical protein AABO57_03345 [Acidobacteriota bacterium]